MALYKDELVSPLRMTPDSLENGRDVRVYETDKPLIFVRFTYIFLWNTEFLWERKIGTVGSSLVPASEKGVS